MKGWPLPLKKDGFCHKPFYKDKETGLMLQPAKGKCVPCLDDRDPCIGTKLPFCGKLKYLTSTAKCRDKDTGGKGGMDRKGHNLNLGRLTSVWFIFTLVYLPEGNNHAILMAVTWF
jgi:hypothetical protein